MGGSPPVWTDAVNVRVTTPHPAAAVSWRLVAAPDGLAVLEVVADQDTEMQIRLAMPLGDAVGFWHPTCGWERTLVADWAGAATVSLVDGAPAGCLFDSTGRALFAFASAETVPQTTMAFGVSEETKSFVVRLRARVIRPDRPYRIGVVEHSGSVAAGMRRLRAWLRDLTAPPLPTPDSAREPAYSTWYAFGQRVRADAVEAEAAQAARLGCGVLILDDGWQLFGSGRGYAGCGDWQPDPAKFADLRGHVRRVRNTHGLRYVLWVAPLLLGPSAAVHSRLSRYAPRRANAPGAYALDPRLPAVREHVVGVCARLVREYELDGLKLDFLDEAMSYVGVPNSGIDIDDIGEAMRMLLLDLRAALEAERPGDDLLIELRQPYVGPGMAPFGNLLRAGDCPADATANRVRTVDIGMLALGGAVHSAMLTWHPSASAESAARQLIGVLQSVPQLSARLGELPESHVEMLAFWLRQWRRLRPLLHEGHLEPGRPDELYPVISASAGRAHAVVVHAERVVPIDTVEHRDITVVNATRQSRVVLDVTGPSASTVLTVYDCLGHVVDHETRLLRPGLDALQIPPSGLATIDGVVGETWKAQREADKTHADRWSVGSQ